MPAPVPRSPAAVFGLLLLLAAVAYAPVVGCGFIWDDDDYVTQNPVLRSAAGLWRIWTEPTALPQYYPLVHTTFWLEYRLWGLAAPGYHVVNVLLHAAAAFGLWRLCRQLALPAALLPAAWFLVHPVHVESVAWITERKNVLSLVLALAALRQWLTWHDGGPRRAFAVGSLCFLGALASKTVVAVVPAAALVVVWWRDGRITRRALAGAVPWLLVGAALAWFTAHLEAVHVRAADPRWQLQGAERLLLACRAPWFYLACLAWPFGLCFNYPRWQLDVHDGLAWAWPAATVVALGLAFGLRHRLGRGPFAVLLLFGGTLVPVLGWFDVYPFRFAFVADHFQYHASVVVFVAAAAWLVPWFARRAPGRVAHAAAALLLLANTALVWRQLPVYRDLTSLWQHTLAGNQHSVLAAIHLGADAMAHGDADAARQLFERALAADPGSDEAWNDLGILAHRAGDRDGAAARYRQALALKPTNAAAANNLATLLLEQGRAAEALPFAERAVAADAEYIEGRMTLAWALHDGGRFAEALAACDHVLQRLPDHVPMRRRAALLQQRLGRAAEAATNAMLVLRAAPADAGMLPVLAATMADVLRREDAATARARAESALRRCGLEPARYLPAVAAALRERGALAHAAALGGG